MTADIDQNRFALMALLTRAHDARPDDYADPQTLVPMSDDSLRSYAVGLLHFLEAEPPSDEVTTEIQEELRSLLYETH